MKSGRRFSVPMWLVAVFCVAFVVFCFTVKDTFVGADKLFYISSLFAMPESADLAIRDFKAELRKKFNISSGDYILFQKDGSIGDIELQRDFSDLTKTPDDIAQTIADEIRSFNFNLDGETKEETYISYQATDSYDKTFVRNVTVNSQLDVKSVIENGCKLPIDDYTQPTVLIYHTHSTERYIPHDDGKFSSDYQGRSGDKSQNMVRIGEELAAVLSARGIGVVHDRNIYDEVYTGAYEKSRHGVNELLKKYPSIVITFDIHRDAIYYNDLTRVKPVAEIDGKKAAQLMIITGSEGGNVESFKNWETNLSFALNLQNAVNTKYENLMKPTYFCNRKYNMDLTPYSLLIEVGTDANTLDEAAYSARLLGDALAEFIKSNKEK